MSVDINPKVVRNLRIQRGWSQGHLAELLDRSTRTVQRFEKTGLCNLETRSALASVFEVGAEHLDRSDSPQKAAGTAVSKLYEAPPPIPMSPAGLFAYANGHSRPNDLLQAFGTRRRLRVCAIDSESAYLNEQIAVLQIKTVRDLDEVIARHAAIALRVSDYIRPEEPVDVAFLISLVLDLVAIDRGGLRGLIT